MDVCGGEKKCLELRNVCSDYRFVAVWLPGFNPDEEYEFRCTTSFMINAGMGLFSFVCFTITIIFIGAYCRRVRRENAYRRIERATFDFQYAQSTGSTMEGEVDRVTASARYRPSTSSAPIVSPTNTEHLFPTTGSNVSIQLPSSLTITRNVEEEKKNQKSSLLSWIKSQYGATATTGETTRPRRDTDVSVGVDIVAESNKRKSQKKKKSKSKTQETQEAVIEAGIVNPTYQDPFTPIPDNYMPQDPLSALPPYKEPTEQEKLGEAAGGENPSFVRM